MQNNTIQMNGISKEFNEVQALKDVSFVFEPGEITGLIGFNGSGKTTTFNILVDFLDATKGDILVGGEKRDATFFKSIGYVSASDSSKNTSRAITELSYFGAISGLSNSKIKERIEYLSNILDFRQYLKKQIGSLSKGNQQKVKIIGALMNPNIKYLLLDEPFDGLDPMMVKKLREFITEEYSEAVIIITSHRMDIVNEMCTKYYILKKGDLVATSEDHEGKDEVDVSVNIETDITSIINLPFVKRLKTENEKQFIVLSSVEDFKELSRELLKAQGYKWHSLEVKSAVDVFWERYGEND